MDKINLNNIHAVIFDLGGVILNIDYSLTSRAFQSLGFNDFDRFYSQAKQSDVFDQFETGKIKPDEFRNFIRSYKNDLSDAQIDFAWNAMLLDLPLERIELLKKLNHQLPIFLLSNTNDIHIEAFLRIVEDTYGTKDLFDHIFVDHYYSSKIGFRKPNENCFNYVVSQNNLDTNKTLFIDDSIQHVEGAKKVGLEAIHLTNGFTINDLFLGKAR